MLRPHAGTGGQERRFIGRAPAFSGMQRQPGSDNSWRGPAVPDTAQHPEPLGVGCPLIYPEAEGGPCSRPHPRGYRRVLSQPSLLFPLTRYAEV